MANVIKRVRTLEDAVTLEIKDDSSSGRRKKSIDKPGADSLDFKKTITTELNNVHSSLSHQITQKIKNHNREMKEISHVANKEGYQTGFDDAVEKERSERIDAIDALLKEAKKKSEDAIRGLEIKIIDLAVYLAEQITHRSITEHPEIVEEIIKETLSYLIGNETVILKVSEDDFKTVNAKYDKWLNMAGSTQEFRLEVDRRLKPGDCIVETEGGIIDAVVAHRLETLAEELRKVSS